METKICTKCKEERILELFCKNKNFKDGYHSQCKLCKKEYNLLNSDTIKIYNKEWYNENKDWVKEYSKLYHDNNPDYQKLYNIEHYFENKIQKENWNLNNPDYHKNYYIDNKEELQIIRKNWYLENREETIQKMVKRSKNRRDIDPLYRISGNLRISIGTSFKNTLNGKYSKSKHTKEILGCDFEEFVKHIESQFKSWMNLENYGNPKDGILELNKTWDLDHIIPLSSAKTEDDLYKLNHYTNFQPLCSYTNRLIKRNKI